MTVARKTKTVVYNKVTRGREGDLMMQNATKLRFEERRFERFDYSSNNFLVFAKIFQFLDRFERNIRGIVGGFEATFDRRAIGGERRKRRGNDAIKEGKEKRKGKPREEDFSVSEGLLVLQVSRKPPQNKDFEGHSATGKWSVY